MSKPHGHSSRGHSGRRRRPLRLPPIDVGRQFLMGRRQPPEGRGSTTTRRWAAKEDSRRCRIPTIMSSVRPSEVDWRVRQGLFHPKIRTFGRTHKRHRGLAWLDHSNRSKVVGKCHCVDGLNFVTRDLALQQATRLYHKKHMIIDALEKRLVEALKSVDAHGDVAPAHVHDPMTMLLRENVVRDNLVRWDDVRGRYVLTGTGRRRIIQGSRAPGAVVSFRNRGVVGSGVLHRKSANTSLKE
jgi:hypothetical protein